jgi:hypothetical protein
MAQGGAKLKGSRRGKMGRGGKIKAHAAKTKNRKLGAVAKRVNKKTKINPGVRRAVKSGRKVHGMKRQKRITGFINNNIEEIMAARVIQAGGTFKSRDLKGKGKAKVHEMHVSMRQKEIARNRRFQQVKSAQEKLDALLKDSDDENELDL